MTESIKTEDCHNRNEDAWDKHYLRAKAKQFYPDENLVRMLAIASRGAALDFGCGSGRHLHLLSEFGFNPVHGLDTSTEAIQLSHKAVPESECRRLHYAELKDSNFQAGLPEFQYHAIIAWGVLHYNPEEIQQNIVRGIARRLHPEGVFLGTLRSDQDTHYQKNQDINLAPIQYFNQNQARALLEPHFKNVELGYTERNPIGDLDHKLAHWIFRCRIL